VGELRDRGVQVFWHRMTGEVVVGAGCSAGFLIVSPGNVGVDLKTMIQSPENVEG